MHKKYVDNNFRTTRLKGKVPQDKSWETCPFSTETIKGNFGVVLDADTLIIDIDVRNGGEESFQNLCRDCGVNFESEAAVIVLSGRQDGGKHLYFKKPEELNIKKKLRAYPGLDFLSKGCQVVGASSIHPDTNKPYVISKGDEALSELTQVSGSLLEKLEKINFEYSKEDIDTCDSKVDVLSYKNFLLRAETASQGENGDAVTYITALKGRDFGLTEETVTACMLEFWNDRCCPPWGQEELFGKVENAFRYSTGGFGSTSLASIVRDCEEYDEAHPGDKLKKAPSVQKVSVVPKEAVTEQKEPPRAFHGGEYSTAEPSNAVLFGARNYPEGRMVTHDEVIYAYNGKYYESWIDKVLEKEVHEEFKLLGFKLSIITGTVKAIKIDTFRPEFAASPNVLCFKNGLLILRNDKPYFEEHSMKYVCKSMVAKDFDLQNNKPTEWLRFLDSSLEGDADRISLLQEWMGYNLISGNPFQKIGLLIGASRSGKGVIGKVLANITGGVGVSLSGLCTEFGLSILYGEKTAIIGDAHQVSQNNYERAKEILLTISGQDKVDINRKFKNIVSTTLETKLTLLANAMPTFTDGSDALINRYLVIPFEKSFSGQEDTMLSQKLDAELPAIINWCVDGYYRIKSSNGKFTIGKKSKEALEEIQEVSNPILSFLNKFCVLDSKESCSSADLYSLYLKYARDELNYSRDMSKPNFGKQLKLVRPGVLTKRVRGGRDYIGIGFRHSNSNSKLGDVSDILLN